MPENHYRSLNVWGGVLLALVILTSGCATSTHYGPGPLKTTQMTAKAPTKSLKIQELGQTQRALLQTRVKALIDEKIISSKLQIYPSDSSLKVFFTAQEISDVLFQKRRFQKCLEFTTFLKEYVFPPSVAASLELITLLSHHTLTQNLETLAQGLETRPIDYVNTSFKSTMFFLQTAFPALIREGYSRAAFLVLDQLFSTYGPIPSYFDQLAIVSSQTPLDALLAAEDSDTFKSSSLKGLILAKKIIAHYEQLEFSVASKKATAFLQTFGGHPLSAQIETIRQQAERKGSWRGWRIGVLLPLTGPYERIGQDLLQGLLFAFRTFSKHSHSTASKGHLTFFPIDTHKYSDSFEETVGDLIEKESLFAIIGPLSTHNHEKMIPVIRKHNIPMLSLAPVLDKDQSAIHQNLPIFNFRPSLKHQVSFVVQFLESRLKTIRKVAILYPQNAFGRFHALTFQTAIDESQKTLTAAQTYPPKDPRSFKTSIQQMLGLFDQFDRKEEREKLIETYTAEHTNPPKESDIELPPINDFDLAYLPVPPKAASIFVPLFKYYNVENVVILAPNIWHHQELILRAAPYLENVVVFDVFLDDRAHPAFANLARRFNKQFLSDFSRNQYLGYLTGSVFLKALSHLPHDTPPHPQHLVGPLSKVEGQTFLNQRYFVSPNGAFCLDPIPLTVIKKQFTRLSADIIGEIGRRFL